MKRAIVVISLLLVAPSLRAQPVEDPGMGEPAKTAAPAPPPAPAPAPAPPPPALAPAPQSRGTMMLPAAPPPPDVVETVDVKTVYVSDPADTVELDARVSAPTLTGGVGLMRTLTGDSGRPGSVRAGLHIGGFQQDRLLVSGNAINPGDTNSRFTGDLTLGYTPWKYLELYLGIYNASNQNDRNDPGRSDPNVILALGDLALGAKARYPVTPFIDLALHAAVRFLASASGIGFEGGATSAAFDAVASWDLRHNRRTEKVPLRLHLNFGYLLDNSRALLPAGECAASTSNDTCIRSRVVETFAHGIGSPRLRLALAADAPITIKRVVGLQPFFEYHLDVAVGDGDLTLLNALRNDGVVGADRVDGQTQQFLTFGVRVRPVGGLSIDTGLDVGLQSMGFRYGPPVPAWNLVFGLAYAYTPRAASRGQIVTRTVTRTVAAAGPASEGKLRGIVRDARTNRPLAGVVVKYVGRRVTPQMTADDGSFVSSGLAPGAVTVEIARDDYEPLMLEGAVVARAEGAVEARLVPRPPQPGQVHARVLGIGGAPVAAATVRFVSSTGAVVDADLERAGAFTARLPMGEYKMMVMGDDFLGRERAITVAAGQVQSLDVMLTRRPAAPRVSVTPHEIALKGAIPFGGETAQLKADAASLLDEIADALVRNPQIRHVRIEGHTDNRGEPQKSLELSKERADAVVGYLVQQGIDPMRLEAQGFGGTQPLLPNLTPAARAKNRRVTFRILEGGGDDSLRGVKP
jgi:outer membrane protein OmpA-like peptidoglycan-associated protein